MKTRPCRLPALLATAAAAAAANAAEIDVGNPDLALRWDTTAKYSLSARVESRDAVYLAPANANGDDGDRNFGKGLISNRADVFTEADLTWQRAFGIRASAAAWYDFIYNKKNDNPGFAGGAFPNNRSVPANEFTHDTRDRMGRKVEWLDGFAFGKFEAGDARFTFRAGQHALVWGESLFFGGNAIAGGMMPVDAIKLASIPGTQFKEAIRPVPMVSGTAQVTPDLSLGAYYQFAWRKTLIPPAGSYFSTSDILQNGGEQLLLGALAAQRLDDRKPKDSGQGGIQLRYRAGDTDLGLYAIRYHEKGPQPVIVLGAIPTPGGPVVAPTNYYLAYNQGVKAYAVSASRSFGVYNVALEVGMKRGVSLASTQGADTSALAPPGVISPTNVTNNPGYATGNTAQANLSLLATLDATPMWREANLTAEIEWNRLLSVRRNEAAVDPNSTRSGFALRMVLEPTYRSVLPGVDIGIPVGLAYAPKGSRPVGAGGPPAWIPADGGDMSIGLNGSFRDAVRFTLLFTHYYGSTAPVALGGIYQWKQALGDRDFVSASVRYSF